MSGWFDTIWADDLPSRAVTVYMYLRSRADREGKCFPSVRTISRDTKLSMSTVRRALDDLINTGYIQKQPRWRANGPRAATNMFLEFNLGSRSVALLVYPHAPKTHN